VSRSAWATASGSPAPSAYSRAMMPARLVSSVTICEPRSNFTSARARSSVLASSAPRGSVSASARASPLILCARSRTDPSLSAKVSLARPACMACGVVAESAR